VGPQIDEACWACLDRHFVQRLLEDEAAQASHQPPLESEAAAQATGPKLWTWTRESEPDSDGRRTAACKLKRSELIHDLDAWTVYYL